MNQPNKQHQQQQQTRHKGFGDFVPTFQPHQERTFGLSFEFYKLFILCWFILGE